MAEAVQYPHLVCQYFIGSSCHPLLPMVLKAPRILVPGPELSDL